MAKGRWHWHGLLLHRLRWLSGIHHAAEPEDVKKELVLKALVVVLTDDKTRVRKEEERGRAGVRLQSRLGAGAKERRRASLDLT